jgi:hypothetical protein
VARAPTAERGDALAKAAAKPRTTLACDNQQTEDRVFTQFLRVRKDPADSASFDRTTLSPSERTPLFSQRAVAVACGLALSAAVMCVTPAAAQSTIMNIPSTDTVAPKKVYFEFDYVLQLPKPEDNQFQTITPRLVFGVTPQFEVGVNVGVTHIAHITQGNNTTYVQPNAKYKFWADDDKGMAASAGFIFYAGNNDADKFGLVYGNFSKKIPSGARFTFGGYAAPSAITDDKGGVILGAEVPVAGKLSFVADWFSGKNFFGYFTPGISVALPHNALFNIGYSLGNDSGTADYRNRALFAYYGIVLN